MYYKDCHRIEDAIIPSLIIQMFMLHDDSGDVIKQLTAHVRKCFSGLSQDKVWKLTSKASDVINKVRNYFADQQMDTHLCLIILLGWILALHKAGIPIDRRSNYCKILFKLYRTLKCLGAFKYNNEAIPHIEVIHNIAQKEGRFC